MTGTRFTLVLLISTLMLLMTGCFLLEEPEAISESAVAPTLEANDDAAASDSGSTSADAVYTIDASQSEARFLIDEVLRGDDVTVVGATNEVAGQIAFDISNPAAAQVGEIVINARGIETDNNFRNRAIANRILYTNEYEFITFTPTALNGLPASASAGESYTFDIVGDLTITDQTGEVTFEATVTPNSDGTLSGLASVNILYADWNLEIPFSQSVDSVEDNVTLELEFVAVSE